jgi:hypothetical protein
MPAGWLGCCVVVVFVVVAVVAQMHIWVVWWRCSVVGIVGLVTMGVGWGGVGISFGFVAGILCAVCQMARYGIVVVVTADLVLVGADADTRVIAVVVVCFVGVVQYHTKNSSENYEMNSILHQQQ